MNPQSLARPVKYPQTFLSTRKCRAQEVKLTVKMVEAVKVHMKALQLCTQLSDRITADATPIDAHKVVIGVYRCAGRMMCKGPRKQKL